MKSVIICIFFALIASSAAKQYWECDAAGKQKCTQDQTCCRSRVNPNGWACFHVHQPHAEDQGFPVNNF